MKKILLVCLFLLFASEAIADDYIVKKVLNWSPPANAIASGSVTRANTKISAVDGTAFVDFSTADVLTNYAANKYRKLTITDSTGKKLVGYIKAAGTGETYGDELLNDAGMEINPTSNWTASNVSTAVETTIVNSGSQAIKSTRTGPAPRIYQSGITTTVGGLYRAAAYGYNASIGAIKTLRIDIISGVAHVRAPDYTTKNEYFAISIYVNAQPASTAVYLLLNYMDDGDIAYWDDASLKQTLTPSTTGVTITATPDGTTYNWESKESGFNYNDESGYTYTITRE